jgi:hypothetical protein
MVSHLLKVALHHVYIRLVVLMFDTRVSDDANAKFVEAHGNFLALFFPIRVIFAIEKRLHVDHRWLCEGKFFILTSWVDFGYACILQRNLLLLCLHCSVYSQGF